MDLYKFVVEANGLAILIQEFGENHDSGVGEFGADFGGRTVWRVCSGESTGPQNCFSCV